MDSEAQGESQPQPLEEDAIDLRIEYSPERQALLWVVEYAGCLSCWSERSLQEAIGGLVLVCMESEDLSASSLTEYGINFDGYNYKSQDALGEAVLCYLSDRGYRFSGQTLGEPSLILCGLGDGDQAPSTEPQKVPATQTATVAAPTPPVAVAPQSATQPVVPVDRPTTGAFGFEAGADPYTQVMFGVHARHVPAWLYVQAQSNGVVLFVGASRSTQLTWGGQKTHQFMLGELIARPHFVVESDRFAGHGISGLARADHLDFLEAADRVVLCDPMRLIEQKAYNTNFVWY